MSKQSYDLLGITETATDEEVTARYEELKKKSTFCFSSS